MQLLSERYLVDGVKYPTVEHFYQCQKFTDVEYRELIRTAFYRQQGQDSSPAEDSGRVPVESGDECHHSGSPLSRRECAS